MEKLTDEEKAKYILADIEPVCGECINFHAVHVWRDEYTYVCKEYDSSITYFSPACKKFKPKFYNN